MSEELQRAVAHLVDLLNAQSASGLITREIIIQTGRVQQLLAREGKAHRGAGAHVARSAAAPAEEFA